MGIDVPLVADIHFNPSAAMEAVKHVEKIRVNPGNFVDTKVFKIKEYSPADYDRELQKLRDKFEPLVKELKSRQVSLRIGTNHGSLSDRIMNRFGDTPEGMVESALEFARICESLDYRDIIFSMKASSPQVMVYAYRLLVARMIESGMNYPLHLGVTEAGDGEDGRVKSAIGIGTLLEDGLGDTIRVSLTEEPEAEVPVAFALLKPFENRVVEPAEEIEEEADPFVYTKRETTGVMGVGSSFVPQIFYSLPNDLAIDEEAINLFGFELNGDVVTRLDHAIDFLVCSRPFMDEERVIIHYLKKAGLKIVSSDTTIADLDYLTDPQSGGADNSLVAFKNLDHLSEQVDAYLGRGNILVVSLENKNWFGAVRKALQTLERKESLDPVVFKVALEDISEEDVLKMSYLLGGVFLDGFGNGLWLENEKEIKKTVDYAYTLFQNLRLRISRTEYISCPSCGRTLFDLQSTTARIRLQTNHLKGVKIAVMGCIVNGPGEMADADFGYVGSSPGKVNLYVGKELIRRGIDEKNADNELIDLIKEHNRWVEPE